ncbi:hypothetical protein BGP78_17370 [Pseudoalteromonas sp. MSK9-3]|uniref:hypothetical protein n=1 Tax=Pseudoalteromonas sp. MSK9-3 TaxID=1897633 RepID=UPI000E6BC5E9|nr:hypothetical protein [Pseudoalteromonas sp. MSK9-3]RJE73744.1 hypothetical protein BGP78_17370 [Pseudoalteromonas sp. MSK9-3]
MAEGWFPENIDAILWMIRDHATVITFIAVAVFIILKDMQALRYAGLCAVFYVVGYCLFDLIIEIDDKKYIFRYIVWTLNDILFMAILAYWAIKDKVYIWQSVIAQLVILPAPLLQLFRLIDRHLLDLTYSEYLYRTILPLVNITIVLLCFAPLVMLFKKNTQVKKHSLSQ